MDVTYFGHACFRLKGKNASVVLDPFDSKMIGLKLPKVSADIVTISHQHGDHNNQAAVDDVQVVIDGPGEYEVKGISFIGISTFHDSQKGKLRGKNTVYVIEIDDIRVAHFGDLGHKLSEKHMEILGEIDVLMIPVGGHYTLDPEDAVSVAQSIEAKITIPMHFQTDGLNEQISKNLAGVDDFLSKMGLPTEKTDKLTLKKEFLGEESKIVVLENK